MLNSINNHHNIPYKQHHHGVPFAPPMGWDLRIRPIQHRKPLSKGLVEGALPGFSINHKKNGVFNLILLLVIIFEKSLARHRL
jgi:hypothetical protein